MKIMEGYKAANYFEGGRGGGKHDSLLYLHVDKWRNQSLFSLLTSNDFAIDYIVRQLVSQAKAEFYDWHVFQLMRRRQHAEQASCRSQSYQSWCTKGETSNHRYPMFPQSQARANANGFGDGYLRSGPDPAKWVCQFPASWNFPYERRMKKPKWSIFRKTVESEIKNDDFFSRWLDGLDTGSKMKSTENSYFYSIENHRPLWSMLTIRIHHIRRIRLFQTILPYFLALHSL